jgi:hypothetical protein
MGIAVALLQGIAAGLLIVIFMVLLVGGLFIVALSGRAVEGQGRSVARPIRLVPGRIACVVGLSLAVTGVFFVDMATDIMGVILGAVGYYLGARILGVAIIIISIITLSFGLVAGQGGIPGSYDEVMNGYSSPAPEK